MIDPDGGDPAILIAHALGAIDGLTYTNSEAAFRQSIECGFEVLEADLAVTRDHEIVLYHHKSPAMESETGWRDKKAHQLSWETLSQKKYMEIYPVLDLAGFIELLKEYREPKIILDMKAMNKSKVFCARRDDEIGFLNSLVLKSYTRRGRDIGAAVRALIRLFGWSETNRIHPHREIVGKLVSMCDHELLDRMIPQVGKDSVDIVDGLYPFPTKIWKPTGESVERAFILAEKNRCRYISLHEKRVSAREIQLSRRHDVKVLVYGAESSDRISKLANDGVSGFYLDKICDMRSVPI